MDAKLQVLICDININIGGHYIGHNQYILDNFHSIEQANPNVSISFLYNKGAKELLHIKRDDIKKVYFIDVKTNGFYQKHKLLKIIKSFSKACPIDHLIFMEFDKYQLSFFIQKFNFKVSGILFRPHHRVLIHHKNLYKTLIGVATRYKKKIAERLLTQNPAIENIFIFNDPEGAECLNRVHNSKHFKYLPDPVYRYRVSDEPVIKENKPVTYKYLVFGWLDERKNITNVIKAFNSTQFPFAVELMLVGPVAENFLKYLHSLLESMESIGGNLKRVTLVTEFVSNEQMEYYFSISDVCLFVYKDFFGSSGLLGRAALHQKKVIGSNNGVIGKSTEKYKLGITCNPYSIESIKDALLGIHAYTIDSALCEQFLNEHSPEAFLRTLTQVQP